jgi:hypothetical protein
MFPAVSKFVGVLSRSTDKLHLEPLIQLFANQLKAKSLADLVALQTLIEEMTGIEALHNISDSQVACFSGGPMLNEEGVHGTTIEHQEPPRSDADRSSQLKADKRPERKASYDKPSQRLISALIKSGLAQPILIAIAQLRKSCVFNATSSAQHTKQLSKKFDEVSGTFSDEFVRGLTSLLLLSAMRSSANTSDCSTRACWRMNRNTNKSCPFSYRHFALCSMTLAWIWRRRSRCCVRSCIGRYTS